MNNSRLEILGVQRRCVCFSHKANIHGEAANVCSAEGSNNARFFRFCNNLMRIKGTSPLSRYLKLRKEFA